MKSYITPNETIKSTDSESINAAISKAKSSGLGRVVIPKNNDRTGTDVWTIDKVISLPDDIEVVIDGAYMVLADGVYSNMFSNVNLVEGRTQQPGATQHNITITGRNGAVLDGGNYNGLSETTSRKNGLPHISMNSTIYFCNAENIRVEGLKLVNQRWWSINNVCVAHSVYRNLEFRADLSRIDENGVHHPDELPRSYKEIYVKNADGIDLRIGCHDILIENISGFTEDDTVALTALSGFELEVIPEGVEHSIHDIVIRNVHSDCYICANVRLLNDDGNKIYNILIDGVKDARENDSYSSCATLRYGDFIYTKKRPSQLGEFYNITAMNVESKSKCTALIAKNLMNASFENMKNVGTGKVFGINKSAELKNCRIDDCLLEDKTYTGDDLIVF